MNRDCNAYGVLLVLGLVLTSLFLGLLGYFWSSNHSWLLAILLFSEGIILGFAPVLIQSLIWKIRG